MAKAGGVLEAKFPRSYALHGGEHIVSLFFDDLLKHKVVKVRFCFLNCFFSYTVTLLTKSLFRLLLLNVAGCIMYLGLWLAMGLMHNSLHILVLQTKARW